MASITFAVNDELKSELSKFTWVIWSELVKQELIKRLERAEKFKRFDEILKNSKMTDEEAFKLADELKRRVAKRHGL